MALAQILFGNPCRVTRELLPEAVADTSHRIDQGSSRQKLLSQRDQVIVNGSVGGRIVGSADTLDDLLASENDAGVLREEAQEAVFRRRERNGNAVHQHLLTGQVDDQILDLESGIGFHVFRAVLEGCPDNGQATLDCRVAELLSSSFTICARTISSNGATQ